jgi:ribosomal protein S18 acetylase RimI-like enzyme
LKQAGLSVLDNPAWSALTTRQAHLALGGGFARRYPEQVTTIAALGSTDDAAFEELSNLVLPGCSISLPATLEGIRPRLPRQLRITLEKNLVQMVCRTPVDVPAPGVELCVLSEADIPEMLALTALTHPGPFRSQTHTLGTYLGIRVDGRLAAMSGQRMHLPGYREISAVCTHPDFQGRGYARTLVSRLVAETFERGLVPILHFEEANQRAREVYSGLGFVERARLPLLVVERLR